MEVSAIRLSQPTGTWIKRDEIHVHQTTPGTSWDFMGPQDWFFNKMTHPIHSNFRLSLKTWMFSSKDFLCGPNSCQLSLSSKDAQKGSKRTEACSPRRLRNFLHGHKIFDNYSAIYIDSSNFGWCFLPKVGRFCLMENGGEVASLQGDNVGHAFTSTSKVGSSCAFPARAPNAGKIEGFMAGFLQGAWFKAVLCCWCLYYIPLVSYTEKRWNKLERIGKT